MIKQVPASDYELMKRIRIDLCHHKSTTCQRVLENGETEDQWYHRNAVALHKFYGLTEQEVLEISGCWIGSENDG